ncbi:MAG: hypothetical protein NC213_04345 [Acetobacter sp.]|nr:hypothetical protein [Bacteroides sp.]MCM1340954.1 hypothetical protein [Acetobacter sp.]MCM1432490.1 hypothetical protein [Clostridiales bacterium]
MIFNKLFVARKAMEIIMQEINEIKVNNIFDDERFQIKKEIDQIYKKIENDIIEDNVAIENMSTNESDELEKCIDKVNYNLKEKLLVVLEELEIPTEAIEIIWSRIKRSVDYPQIKSCGTEKISYSDLIENSKEEYSDNQEFEKYKMIRNISGTVAGITGITTVLLLMVPAWREISAIIKIADSVLCVGSSALAVYSHSKYNNMANSDYIPEFTINDYIKGVCNDQADLNKSAIIDWLDKVRDAFIKECENEMEYYQ